MQERMFQFTDTSRRQVDFGVHPTILIPALVAAEETNYIVTVPTAMIYLVTKVMSGASDPIAIVVCRWGPQHLPYLVRKLWRDAFVGVHQQHPLVTCLWNRPILKVGRVDVFALNNPASAHLAHDIQRSVS